MVGLLPRLRDLKTCAGSVPSGGDTFLHFTNGVVYQAECPYAMPAFISIRPIETISGALQRIQGSLHMRLIRRAEQSFYRQRTGVIVTAIEVDTEVDFSDGAVHQPDSIG